MSAHNDDHPSQAKQTRKAWAGFFVVLVAVVVAAVVVLANGLGSGANPASAKESALTRSTTALLSGIPQSGNVLGSHGAPVTLQFFGDLQCPTSRAFTLEMLPALIARWVRADKLRVEYRSLKTATPSAQVFMTQQAAALAAGKQHKLWDYIEYFYHEQGREDSGYATEGFLRRLAGQTPGLDLGQWNEDRKETSLAAQVATDEQAAARMGLYETPSLLVGPTGREGRRSRLTLVEPEALGSAIEGLLGERPRHSNVSTDKGSALNRLEVAYREDNPSKADRGRVAC